MSHMRSIIAKVEMQRKLEQLLHEAKGMGWHVTASYIRHASETLEKEVDNHRRT